MYCTRNFRTKKELKEAVAAHQRGEGPAVTVYQPNQMYPAPRNGRAAVEGPHYPQPHRWYASVVLKDGAIIKVAG